MRADKAERKKKMKLYIFTTNSPISGTGSKRIAAKTKAEAIEKAKKLYHGVNVSSFRVFKEKYYG